MKFRKRLCSLPGYLIRFNTGTRILPIPYKGFIIHKRRSIPFSKRKSKWDKSDDHKFNKEDTF